MLEQFIDDEPDQYFGQYPIVPIRPGIDDTPTQPASQDTIKALIKEVHDLTPPPEKDRTDPYLYARRKKLGKYVLIRSIFSGSRNSPSADYYAKIKDIQVVSIEVHNEESALEVFDVDGNDEDGYELKKKVYVEPGEMDLESSIEIEMIVDETAALALLGIVSSLKSE